jgi:hypothetical protein
MKIFIQCGLVITIRYNFPEKMLREECILECNTNIESTCLQIKGRSYYSVVYTISKHICVLLLHQLSQHQWH